MLKLLKKEALADSYLLTTEEERINKDDNIIRRAKGEWFWCKKIKRALEKTDESFFSSTKWKKLSWERDLEYSDLKKTEVVSFSYNSQARWGQSGVQVPSIVLLCFLLENDAHPYTRSSTVWHSVFQFKQGKREEV